MCTVVVWDATNLQSWLCHPTDTHHETAFVLLLYAWHEFLPTLRTGLACTPCLCLLHASCDQIRMLVYEHEEIQDQHSLGQKH
jgi:hypothetical protein